MSLTLRQAIDKTLDRISLATGSDTQTYSELPIKQMIQHKFDALFDEHWWPQFRFEGQFTLDGSTGVITADISSDIRRYDDIRYVWHDKDSRPLPRAPGLVNPTSLKRKCIAPVGLPDKLFKVYPATTTGDVYLVGRSHPGEFVSEGDLVNFDEHLIVLGTAYDYLNGIGTNPSEEEKLLSMFTARLNQLVKNMNSGELSVLDYADTNIPTTWQEY